MTNEELQAHLLKAAKCGTLVTPKHDSQNVGWTWRSYRTVIAPHLADKLDGFIASGLYEVEHYHNQDPNHSPDVFVLIPSTADFSVPGSGIPAFSSTPAYPCDRIIAVSGGEQGWHIYTERSEIIAAKVAQGTWTQSPSN